MKTVASSVNAFFSLCRCRKYCDNVCEMAPEIHVYFVTIESGKIVGDLNSIAVPRDSSVQQFFELLIAEKNVDKNSHRLRVLDYQGLFVAPSSFILPLNTPDTPYGVIVVPKNTYYNNKLLQPPPNCSSDEWSELRGFNLTRGELSNDIKTELSALDCRITEIEKLVHKENNSTAGNCLRSLKNDFKVFRAKLEHGLLIHCMSPSTEISPGHRKIKYRRLSSAKQREVRKKFWDICNETLSEEVMQALRLPTFDCNEWTDDEILLLLQHIFIDFDFLSKFNINVNTLRNFLFQIYKNYNNVPFHNFRHSFCVTQMMYVMVSKVNLSRILGDIEILVLIIACICHDLDHPGFNNIYQINAHTELAIRYNDISPLENHHCSMAFRIMQLPECNIFENFDGETFRYVREGIIRCILATDMARHNEILLQFKDSVDDGYNFNLRLHINLLCMVLIKVADISNEARPMDIADPWLDKLFVEFFTQSDLEKRLGLPVTPFMDSDKITKPSSQCSFIGFVLLPLFEALGILFNELEDMIVQPVRDALEFYRKLNDAEKQELRQQRKSVVTLETCSSNATSPSSPATGLAMLHAPPDNASRFLQQKSEDASMFSDEGALSLEELMEEDDEETVTEVAVSEKTLKFKISTESSGSKSHPGSRKGSREKTQDLEMARAYRYERSNRASDSGDKRSWSSSENTSSADDRRNEIYQSIPERTRHHSLFNPTTSIPESLREHHILTEKFQHPPQAIVPVISAPASSSASASSKIESEQPQQQEQEQDEQQQQSQQTKPSSSNKSSPDLKRLMNRVVRDLRGNRGKIANGVKTTGEESTSKDERNQSTSTRQTHKEQKSPGWMASLFQNIKLRSSSSHEPDTHS